MAPDRNAAGRTTRGFHEPPEADAPVATHERAFGRYVEVLLLDDHRRPRLPTTIASIEVVLHTPSVDQTWRPRYRKPRNPHAAPTRRELITALMEEDPSRPWRGRELADKLGTKPRNMLTQLAEWTRLGFLTRTYQLPTRRDTASP